MLLYCQEQVESWAQRGTTMSLAPLDSLLPSLPVFQSPGVQGLCHFIQMAHGSGIHIEQDIVPH